MYTVLADFLGFLAHVQGYQTWSEAKRLCEERGGRLPEIRSEDSFREASWISFALTGWFWLGGSDEQEEGVWRWESNNEVVDRSMFWGEEEPTGTTVENCLLMTDSFNDYPCAHGHAVV